MVRRRGGRACAQSQIAHPVAASPSRPSSQLGSVARCAASTAQPSAVRRVFEHEGGADGTWRSPGRTCSRCGSGAPSSRRGRAGAGARPLSWSTPSASKSGAPSPSTRIAASVPSEPSFSTVTCISDGSGSGTQQVGDREELGEAVVPLPVLEAEAIAAQVDVDDAAAEDAGARRVVGAEDVDPDLVVLEEEVADVGHRRRGRPRARCGPRTCLARRTPYPSLQPRRQPAGASAQRSASGSDCPHREAPPLRG